MLEKEDKVVLMHFVPMELISSNAPPPVRRQGLHLLTQGRVVPLQLLLLAVQLLVVRHG